MGRRKIVIRYIDDRRKRQISFAKRRSGAMKKVFELSKLSGSQILFLVATEDKKLHGFATKQFQPLLKDDERGREIYACLSSGIERANPSAINEFVSILDVPDIAVSQEDTANVGVDVERAEKCARKRLRREKKKRLRKQKRQREEAAAVAEEGNGTVAQEASRPKKRKKVSQRARRKGEVS